MEVRVIHREPISPIEKIVVELTHEEANRFVKGVQMAGPFEREGLSITWFFTQVAAAIEEQLK